MYSNYDRGSLAGDFNAEVSGNVMDLFLYQQDLKNLVKDQACFNNSINLSTIDLFLTNNSLALQKQPLPVFIITMS